MTDAQVVVPSLSGASESPRGPVQNTHSRTPSPEILIHLVWGGGGGQESAS